MIETIENLMSNNLPFAILIFIIIGCLYGAFAYFFVEVVMFRWILQERPQKEKEDKPCTINSLQENGTMKIRDLEFELCQFMGVIPPQQKVAFYSPQKGIKKMKTMTWRDVMGDYDLEFFKRTVQHIWTDQTGSDTLIIRLLDENEEC